MSHKNFSWFKGTIQCKMRSLSHVKRELHVLEIEKVMFFSMLTYYWNQN